MMLNYACSHPAVDSGPLEEHQHLPSRLIFYLRQDDSLEEPYYIAELLHKFYLLQDGYMNLQITEG